MLGLLTLLWLLGTAATTAGIWRETDEVLDSALTATAQRLLLLPAAAMAERGNGAVAVDGSGLGLSLVATIARQSGARLVLQSPRADGHGFGASLHFDGATPPN